MDNICDQEGCSLKVYAKGKCHYHRMVEMYGSYSSYQKERIAKKPICTVEHCKNNQYAKGLCRTHYNMKIKGQEPSIYRYRYTVCKFEGCQNAGKYDGLCLSHKKYFDKNGRLFKSNKGEYNRNWKGGVADYPCHSTFKRNRLIVLGKHNGLCAECGKKATNIHHIDFTKTNHEIENLIPLCTMCHMKKHTGRKNKISKHKKQLGMILKDVAKLRGVSEASIKRWLDVGIFEHKMSNI